MIGEHQRSGTPTWRQQTCTLGAAAARRSGLEWRRHQPAAAGAPPPSSPSTCGGHVCIGLDQSVGYMSCRVSRTSGRLTIGFARCTSPCAYISNGLHAPAVRHLVPCRLCGEAALQRKLRAKCQMVWPPQGQPPWRDSTVGPLQWADYVYWSIDDSTSGGVKLELCLKLAYAVLVNAVCCSPCQACRWCTAHIVAMLQWQRQTPRTLHAHKDMR
jgi:hypothetical protein